MYYPEFFEESISRMKRLALRYTGFKFYLLVLLCGFIWSILLTAFRVQALSPTDLLGVTWFEYLWIFWGSHPWFLLIFTIIFIAVIVLNVLEGPFSKRVLLLPALSHQDDRTRRLLGKLNWYLSGAFFLSFLMVVPVIHLWLPAWYSAAAFVAGLASTLISAWFALVRPDGKPHIQRLGRYRFRGAPSFNTASMGAEAMEVKRELAHYERLREVSPINAKVKEYLRDGDQNYLWQGLRQFYERMAGFFQVPAVWITTHQNTTKAIRHALKLCVNAETKIVTTDLEFPSVLQTVTEVAPADRVSVVRVRDSHVCKRLDYREIVDTVAEEVNHLAATSPDARLVLVLSHVTYLTGAVLDIQRLREKLQVDPNRVVLIVDGAQAAGNINVGRTFMESCDFYASSGHKWLLGKTTLGILIHEPDNVYKKLSLDLERVREGTVPFSHIDFDLRDYTGETVDMEQIVSLNAMLVEFNAMGQGFVAEHNRGLAREFSNLVTRIRGVFVVSSPVQSGIVSLRIRPARDVADALERNYGYIGQALEPDILRFSFHYYMDQRDVYCLVDALNDVMNRQFSSYAQLNTAPVSG